MPKSFSVNQVLIKIYTNPVVRINKNAISKTVLTFFPHGTIFRVLLKWFSPFKGFVFKGLDGSVLSINVIETFYRKILIKLLLHLRAVLLIIVTIFLVIVSSVPKFLNRLTNILF